MSDTHEVEEFPDEIKVNEGHIPTFLKLVYVGFTAFGFLYFFLYYAGDADKPLVKLLNAATGH